MASESPASVLFSRDGYDVVITDGYTITSSRPGIIVAGKDGSTARFLALDSLGHPIVVGTSANAAVPLGNPLLIAGSDGYVRTIRTTSDGTIRIDPTGTTVQPVSQSGTWTVNQGTTPWLTLSNVTDGYLQNILANQTNGTQHTIVDGYVQTNPNVNLINWLGSTAPTVGQKTMTASIPVTIASNQSTLTVNASATVGIVDNATFTDGTTRIQPSGYIFDEVAGTALTENDGAAARIDAKRAQIITIEDNSTRGLRTVVKAASTAAVASDPALVVAISPNNTVAISAVSLPLPAGAATEATLLNVLTTSSFQARINTLGQKTMANSTPVVIASDQSAIPVSQNGTWTVQQGAPPWSVSQNGTWTVQQGTPPWSVVGPGAAGAAIAGDPVRIGASDGAITRNILSDAGGRLQIVGAAPNGAAVAGNPVLIGGSDGANARTIRTATDGTIRIDPTGTTIQPISGTVTSNQGTSPWINNITQFGGSNVVTGTGASGTGIPRVTVSNDSNILVTQSGAWTVQQGTPPWTITGTASDNTTNSIIKLPVLSARANTSSPSWTDGYQVPLSTLLTGALRTDVTSWLGSTLPTVGQKVMASSIPVTMANDQPPIPVTFNITGDTTGVSFGIRKLGGGSAGVLFAMEATTYTEPTSAAQRSMASSSASDNSAGTGARTVEITYYDNVGNGPFTEIITLNGTTPVNTVATNIRFIEKMEVVTAGSVGSNIGTITLYGSTGGAGGTIGSIGISNILTGIGDNKTLWAHHYVGAGLTAKFSVIVTGIQSGGSATNGTFFIRYIDPLMPNATEILIADAVLIIGAFERVFTFNPTVSGFARVTAYGIPGVNNSTMTCSFDWSEQ